MCINLKYFIIQCCWIVSWTLLLFDLIVEVIKKKKKKIFFYVTWVGCYSCVRFVFIPLSLSLSHSLSLFMRFFFQSFLSLSFDFSLFCCFFLKCAVCVWPKDKSDVIIRTRFFYYNFIIFKEKKMTFHHVSVDLVFQNISF